MARPRRSEDQHGYFHVWNRGVDQQDIFLDDQDRRTFLGLVVEAADGFGVEVHAFSLMTNHFHLLVNCPDGNLSLFAQRFQKRYAEVHNHRADRVGHLFGSRFAATLLDDGDEQFDGDAVMMTMGRYIHRNPLDRMQRIDLEHDPFSSYGVYVGRRPRPSWLRTDVLLSLHGDRPDVLRRFTERPHPSDKTPRNGQVDDPYTLDDVLRAVSASSSVSLAAVLSPSAGLGNPVRDLAAHVCSLLRVEVPAVLADEFGVSLGGFRRMASRAKHRCATDQGCAHSRRAVMDELWRRHLSSVEQDAA